MPTAVRIALALTLCVAAGGCRQPDGPLPTPARDQSNEIGDIARDLMNVANKDPQAPEELKSDLSKYGHTEEAVAQINALSNDLAQAIGAARLEEQTAQSLAKTLWVGLNGRELSERQVDVLEREVKGVLAPTGVPEARAQAIADRLGEVQKVITNNPRRWHHVF
jgi:hypothetical protein